MHQFIRRSSESIIIK